MRRSRQRFPAVAHKEPEKKRLLTSGLPSRLAGQTYSFAFPFDLTQGGIRSFVAGHSGATASDSHGFPFSLHEKIQFKELPPIYSVSPETVNKKLHLASVSKNTLKSSANDSGTQSLKGMMLQPV